MAHVGHHITICSKCGIRMGECRCMAQDKQVVYDICEQCKSSMQNICWDCDGVLRDLDQILIDKYGIPTPNEWDWNYKGLNVFQWIAKDFKVLSDAPKTKYFDTFIEYARKLNDSGKTVEIWTNQSKEWQPDFWLWMVKNVDPYKIKYKVRFLTRQQKFNELNKSSAVSYLVEDHPFLPVSSKILFIDHPYNRNSKQPNRIKSVNELKNKLGI